MERVGEEEGEREEYGRVVGVAVGESGSRRVGEEVVAVGEGERVGG